MISGYFVAIASSSLLIIVGSVVRGLPRNPAPLLKYDSIECFAGILLAILRTCPSSLQRFVRMRLDIFPHLQRS